LCQSVNEYYRIVKRLGLEILGGFFCCVCGRRLSPDGWGERRHLKMRIRRACCRVCVIRYTILPVFVAPAKWFSYIEIERALLFISWSEFRSVTAGLKAWEIERQHRIDNGVGAGPAASTVRLWWKILGQTRADGHWMAQDELEQALAMTSRALPVSTQTPSDSAAITILPEEPWVATLSAPARQAPVQSPEPIASPGKVVLQQLRTLGKTLLVQWPVALAASLLAIGAWFLDGEIANRCLAPTGLAGRVIPCRSPSLAVTDEHLGEYPLETSPPP
jgi:hypothetical protein